MPLNSEGQYFSNPKQGAMHEKYDKHGQKSQEGHMEENSDGKGAFHVYAGHDGSYKSVSEKGDGSVEEHDHPDINEVTHHMMSHFGEAKPQSSDDLDDDAGQEPDDDADDQMDSGDVSRSDSGAY